MSRNPYCADPLRECRRKVAALNADKKVLSDSEATLLRRVRELTRQRDELLEAATAIEFAMKLPGVTGNEVLADSSEIRIGLQAAIASVKGAA